MEHAMHELKLNVSQFYQDDEVRHLLTSEEAPPFPGSSEEDFFLSGERYYEVFPPSIYFENEVFSAS